MSREEILNKIEEMTQDKRFTVGFRYNNDDQSESSRAEKDYRGGSGINVLLCDDTDNWSKVISDAYKLKEDLLAEIEHEKQHPNLFKAAQALFR